MSPIPERSDWYRANTSHHCIDNNVFCLYPSERKKTPFSTPVLPKIFRQDYCVISPEKFPQHKASDSLRRERYFKTTKGKTTLRMMLKDYFCVEGKNQIIRK